MKYALITPARDEAEFIGLTAESVIAQTDRPVKWVVVSDGSTDGTDEIVRQFAARHDWIELVRMPERTERNFSGKVHAFNAGLERLKGLDFDVIGNLDADISFDSDYFAFLLEQFAADPKLGVAGTPFREGKEERYDYRFASSEHVSGACQLFRRECFEAIGGYQPIRGGGIDWVAVTTARMRGWRTRTFRERSCVHGRPIGTAQTSTYGARFKQGAKDYRLGGHPLWQAFRSLHQMRQKPYLTGGALLMLGFAWSAVTGAARVANGDLRKFHRQEQMTRLKAILFGSQPR